MQSTAALVLLLAPAPFFLLPALIAHMSRKRHRAIIIGLNVALLATIVGGIMFAGGPLLRLDGSLVSWLALLGFALKRDSMPAAMLDEPVTLAPYDALWPKAFEAERTRICAALELPPDAIEHIGSTAVPGLIAKPIVDLMLGMPRYPPPDSTISRLVILGYQDLGEAGVAGRRYLRMREGPSFNLHVVLRGGEHWTNNLRLREFLRHDARACQRYAEAKRAALEKSGQLLGYSAAKQPALAELLADSGAVKDA